MPWRVLFAAGIREYGRVQAPPVRNGSQAPPRCNGHSSASEGGLLHCDTPQRLLQRWRLRPDGLQPRAAWQCVSRLKTWLHWSFVRADEAVHSRLLVTSGCSRRKPRRKKVDRRRDPPRSCDDLSGVDCESVADTDMVAVPSSQVDRDGKPNSELFKSVQIVPESCQSE